jgi:hypothetical protein
MAEVSRPYRFRTSPPAIVDPATKNRLDVSGDNEPIDKLKTKQAIQRRTAVGLPDQNQNLRD